MAASRGEEAGMTSRDRLFTSLQLGVPDRVPFAPRAREFAVRYAGYRYGDILTDVDKYVDAQLRLVEDFHADALWGYGTTPHFIQLVGGKLIVFDDDVPTSEPAVHSREQIARLDKNPDFARIPALSACLEIIRKMKKEVGSSALIIGYFPMPFRFAAEARGLENLMLDLILNPDLVRELQEYFIPIATRYAEALIEAGADVVTETNEVANKNCISRKHFEELVHPYCVAQIAQLKERGIKSIFHLCGNWSDRLDLAVAEGAECIWVDKVEETSIAYLKRTFGSKACIMGDVHVVKTLLQGTPEEVTEATRESIEEGKPGGGFILSGSCSVPRDIPPENLHAMDEACQKYGRY